MASTDSDRAVRLASLAERTAIDIADHHLRALALAEIARSLADTHLDRAARLALSAEIAAEDISDKDWKVVALAEIARVLAGTGIEEHRNRSRPVETAPGPLPTAYKPDVASAAPTEEQDPVLSQSSRWTRWVGRMR